MARSPLSAWLKQAPWLALAGFVAWHLLDWALIQAVFRPDLAACQALAREGACWGVVPQKGLTWLFGRYPEEWRWRPALSLLLWAAALLLLLRPLWPARLKGPLNGPVLGSVLLLCLGGLAVLAGHTALGHPSLAPVDSSQWGGLPLTLLLTAGALSCSLPLALLLAWARLSPRALWSWPAVLVIEVVRGAPLVMWLFMAAFLLPALLPEAWGVGPVARVWLVTTVFSAAYAAEILRGSLRVVAQDQTEAATVLGAHWWQRQRLVILPQAFRSALPALVNHTIGLLKDTALVMVVSLQDLTGSLSMSLNGDADWRPYFLEAYLFIALVYAAMCLGVAAVGRALERRYPALGVGQ